MHLTSIKIRGFKSFPDPIEVRLEPGVAVVVGPNGSGKSNVVDAIVWAAGSLSPSELRADRADDVLFAGSSDRPPAEWCEVELLFDSADGGPAGIDFAELSIVRRLHLGGEGQYLINRSAVRRLDVVELLADVGLGTGMHSIVGQGRVEAILASRPQERRALVEEAAGLGRFKQQRHRAELKLARVAADVARARDVEAEVKSRLRPLALQATAAERAERLRRDAAVLEATIAALDLAALDERRDSVEERRAALALTRKRTEGRLEALLADRDRAEEELADVAGRREQATAALYRLRSATERIQLRRETGQDLLARVAPSLAAAEETERTGPSWRELEEAAVRAEADARAAAAERETVAEQARLARERLGALERSLAEREGLPPAARALAERGVPLALPLLDVDPGCERAVAAALAWRSSAVVAEDAETAVALADRARAEGLGSLGILFPGERPQTGPPPVPGAELLADRVEARAGTEWLVGALSEVWLVEPEDLLRATHGVVVTRAGVCFDAARGELSCVGETAEVVLLELEARRRALEQEAAELASRAESAAGGATEAAARAQEAAERLASVRPPGHSARLDPAALGRLVAAAERLTTVLSETERTAARFEPGLRARADVGAEKVNALGLELRRLGAAEADLRREAATVGEQAAAIDVELARLQAEADAARARLDAAGEPPTEPAGEDRGELERKLERLRTRLHALGEVNPLAKEEYAREKERLEGLAGQRSDLEQSLAELERLRAELTETVDRRFAETFASVQKHFEEVAATLFPGGAGRLRLTEDPSDEGDEAVPDVEVELRPAGKRVTKLSLLSGGEKALGAIAFLFALFLSRPCPFYLLDEVEAALDDPNIGRFIELLRRYADRAQFVVVTHQKRTMEAADILYGVTMGADGVSKVVSRRVPRADVEPAGVLASA